ncbi:uncharacterized protein LOC112561488, partial [Pomacea canaliculata]|uniref:uncharacterized protein LOC112561488 n=1 Tax=Pomacea canaliculata TaxID=400727 RepID=UPI000D733FFC
KGASLLFVLAVTGVFVDVEALVPIPSREVGFVYKSGSADAAVRFNIYIDLICPASMQAFSTVKKVADYYGPSVLRLTTYLFPLPYHRNGFYAAKGAHAVAMMTCGNLTYSWFGHCLQKHGLPDQLRHRQHLRQSSGRPHGQVEMDTRIGWKYCCTRGVASTPTFMVNDVEVSADPSWTENEWLDVINPLLGKTQLQHRCRST